MFSLLLRICQKSEDSQNSTLKWSKIDLNVWNVRFGGVFLLKSGFEFSVPTMETCFLACCFLDKCIHFGNLQYTENGVSVAPTKNPRPLFNRNTPPKLTFHTFRSTFDHSKVLFWLPSDFWRIWSNNENIKMPIQQNMFDQKVTSMVLIVLDLWVNNKFAWKF